jgi:hypothetical protein
VTGPLTATRTHDPPPGKLWARVRDDARTLLRRGAWCPVLGLTTEEAILDAGGRHVTVPRAELILAVAPPAHWTVVARPVDAVNVPPQWGQHYAVCPSCSHRAPVGAPTLHKRCSRCGDAFPLAGDDVV